MGTIGWLEMITYNGGSRIKSVRLGRRRQPRDVDGFRAKYFKTKKKTKVSVHDGRERSVKLFSPNLYVTSAPIQFYVNNTSVESGKSKEVSDVPTLTEIKFARSFSSGTVAKHRLQNSDVASHLIRNYT